MFDPASRRCRVCGFEHDDPPWGDDGLTPTFEICPCCGVEFGYEDISGESISRYREAWIAGGAEWFDPKAKPVDWDLQRQLARLREPGR